MNWIDLAQDRNKGRAVLKEVTNFRVLCKKENIFNSGERIRFSKNDSAAWTFFSPGATTPIGGCILQPFNGL